MSDSLLSALQHALKLHTLVRNIGTISLHHHPQHSSLEWHPKTPVTHFMADELFSSWLAFAQQCCEWQAPLMLNQVKLMRPQPPINEVKQYQSVFNCPIEFNSTTNSMIFDSQLLHCPLKGANNTTPARAFKCSASCSGISAINSQPTALLKTTTHQLQQNYWRNMQTTSPYITKTRTQFVKHCHCAGLFWTKRFSACF